jgi:hypothetical protein
MLFLNFDFRIIFVDVDSRVCGFEICITGTLNLFSFKLPFLESSVALIEICTVFNIVLFSLKPAPRVSTPDCFDIDVCESMLLLSLRRLSHAEPFSTFCVTTSVFVSVLLVSDISLDVVIPVPVANDESPLATSEPELFTTVVTVFSITFVCFSEPTADVLPISSTFSRGISVDKDDLDTSLC